MELLKYGIRELLYSQEIRNFENEYLAQTVSWAMSLNSQTKHTLWVHKRTIFMSFMFFFEHPKTNVFSLRSNQLQHGYIGYEHDQLFVLQNL